jgi:hypothetical protein
MSESVPEANHELAKVLSRINILMGQAGKPAEDASAEKDIPQLTDVYVGEPLSFMTRSADEFPLLNQATGDSLEAVTHLEQPSPEVVEALLAEMMPVIQAIIQKAVLQELENSEQPLCDRLEMEIMQSLRENLQSRLF